MSTVNTSEGAAITWDELPAVDTTYLAAHQERDVATAIEVVAASSEAAPVFRLAGNSDGCQPCRRLHAAVPGLESNSDPQLRIGGRDMMWITTATHEAR
jgi:hypothetical protein